jgi:hypothetical protein
MKKVDTPKKESKHIIVKDSTGKIRAISYMNGHYRIDGLETPEDLALSYVQSVVGDYGINPKILSKIEMSPQDALTDDPTLLLTNVRKSIGNRTTISYQQTHFGLRVWGAGFTVVMQNEPLGVTHSRSSLRDVSDVQKPSDESLFLPNKPAVREKLANVAQTSNAELTIITLERLVIYKYDSDKRLSPETKKRLEEDMKQQPPQITLELQDVLGDIADDENCIVNEVLFTLKFDSGHEVHWRALLEVVSGSILYLRALLSASTGLVFMPDPQTSSGNPEIFPIANPSVLNQHRIEMPLARLNPPVGGQVALAGQYVEVDDINFPNVQPPQRPVGAAQFNFPVDSNDFAGVSAYFHCDAAIDLVAHHVTQLNQFIPATDLPIRVDHRSSRSGACSAGICANAFVVPNASTTGVEYIEFMLASSDANVGMAADGRIALHELSHVILLYQINFLNLEFCHSFGDSLVAIRYDPGSQLRNVVHLGFEWRFWTFPFTFWRWHNQPVADGWGWGGIHDDEGYLTEQILSTTLFRAYRAMGGDNEESLTQREEASEYMIHLIINGASLLVSSIGQETDTPEEYWLTLADADSWNSGNRLSDGCGHKVLRWSFEVQNAFVHTLGATTTNVPPVDVFIDDGRGGEYGFQPFEDLTNSDAVRQSIWNRQADDGGTEHQTPRRGVTNFAYVRVRNRGYDYATNVSVRGFTCGVSSGLVFPDDWTPMQTASLNVPGSIAPGAEVIVGPFSWMPSEDSADYLCMSVSADGDVSNIETNDQVVVAIENGTLQWDSSRLVPLDNNIAMRNAGSSRPWWLILVIILVVVIILWWWWWFFH